jgi:hypothetical protein
VKPAIQKEKEDDYLNWFKCPKGLQHKRRSRNGFQVLDPSSTRTEL